MGPLTFEHVPPRKAYNDYPAILYTLEEWEHGQAGTYLEGGRGGHYLCQRCNNQSGGDYGGAFVDWVRQGMERIDQIPGRHALIYHGVVYPLRVLKQITVIFFDTALPSGHRKHRELARFVINRESKQLPSGYRFFVFWYGGGELRQSGIVGALSIEAQETSVLADFVHPPFGYVLSFSGPIFDRRPEEITDFARFEYNEAIHFHRRFPILETHWIMPGDYRTREQIDRDRTINGLEAAGITDAREIVEQLERGGG